MRQKISGKCKHQMCGMNKRLLKILGEMLTKLNKLYVVIVHK